MAKKITIILVVIMLIVGFAIGLVSSPFIVSQNSSSTDSAWANIEKTGVIKVGTDPTWPPYQEIDNSSGKIVGFEVDLANACAAKLNLKIDWQNVGFDNIIASVQGGQLDMGVSGFSITKDRLDQVAFTIPHSVSQSQIIMLKSTMDKYHITNTTITSLSQLKDLGIVVGVQDGEVEQQELQAAGVQMHSWSDSASATMDMISSNPSVQAVYAETPVTNAWIDQYASSNIQVVYSHPFYPVAFVVAKSSHTLLDEMNGALTELIADGTVDQLKAQWHAQT